MEQALLVVIQFDQHGRRRDGDDWPLADERQELEELVRSSGCRVAGEVIVPRLEPHAGTLLGAGKLEEIAERAREIRAGVVIFNQELSPAQQRNIEDVVDVKTIDRTQLILDIFAQRATSQEGKVQVELAQSRYLMPRLVGKGLALSRLGGGIGTRGPGEQKLEVDRRRIRQRIARLQDELEKLGVRREATRQRRKEAQVPVVALVGYTNTGKTTLLNRLTGETSRAEQRMFTTLDPLARRLRLPSPAKGGGPGGRWIVLTDTVGFLHRLPHHLIEAFQATLEETRAAHVLLHVVDASHPLAIEHAKAVTEVLKTLEITQEPVVVLNKIDRLNDPAVLPEFRQAFPIYVEISALHGQGIERLLAVIESSLDVPRLPA